MTDHTVDWECPVSLSRVGTVAVSQLLLPPPSTATGQATEPTRQSRVGQPPRNSAAAVAIINCQRAGAPNPGEENPVQPDTEVERCNYWLGQNDLLNFMYSKQATVFLVRYCYSQEKDQLLLYLASCNPTRGVGIPTWTSDERHRFDASVACAQRSQLLPLGGQTRTHSGSGNSRYWLHQGPFTQKF